jgi:riboflavin biosynthesis pyrimidine reductase
VATLGDGKSAGSVISGRHQGDRFLMALLRACADAVVLGAGTLRATPGHVWTPAHVYPQLAESFAGLRRSLGRSPEPRLVLVTAEGDIDVSHPAVQRGALVLTTSAGSRALAGRLPSTCEVVAMGEGSSVDLTRAVDELRSHGLAVLLTEGGPHLMGEFLRKDLIDEAFVTVSPLLAGRDEQPRWGMVEGVELQPPPGLWTRLLSARRHGDHLFLRYGVKGELAG